MISVDMKSFRDRFTKGVSCAIHKDGLPAHGSQTLHYRQQRIQVHSAGPSHSLFEGRGLLATLGLFVALADPPLPPFMRLAK